MKLTQYEDCYNFRRSELIEALEPFGYKPGTVRKLIGSGVIRAIQFGGAGWAYYNAGQVKAALNIQAEVNDVNS